MKTIATAKTLTTTPKPKEDDTAEANIKLALVTLRMARVFLFRRFCRSGAGQKKRADS